MVQASFDKQTNQVLCSFSGSNFQEILETVKEDHWEYLPDEYLWTTSPFTAFKTLKYIASTYEAVHISKEDIQLIKEKRFKFDTEETAILGVPFNSKWIKKYPPVLGKAPHEHFQLECIKRGLVQDKFAFFLGMGSGKTYIVLQVINHLIDNDGLDKMLILTPPEGVVNWRREILAFSPFFKKNDIVISTANNNRNPFESDGKVVIMTYRHFLTVSDDFHKLNSPKSRSKKYRKPTIPFDSWGNNRAIILDESHNIKNMKARQSHVLHLHRKYFKYRYLLTGTPSPNNFGEIYSQMKFMDSSLVPGNFTQWLSMVASIGNRFSKYAVNYFYEDEVKKWEKVFSTHVVRYISDEILDLPELFVNKIYFELPKLQSEIYRALIEHVIYTLKEDNNGILTPKLMLNKFPYISMALENPLLLKGKIENPHLASLVNHFKFERDHGKFDVLTSMVDEYIHSQKRKVIIFDYHPLTMDILNTYFERHGYKPLLIHGQNTPKGIDATDFRSNILDIFKKSKDHNLLIASSRVLATAVNLQEASRAIYFSRDYSYLSWSQSQKRLHRIGQKSQVIINPYIYEDSLDVRLDGALEKKQNLDKNIFSKESLSALEWKKIFLGEAV